MSEDDGKYYPALIAQYNEQQKENFVKSMMADGILLEKPGENWVWWKRWAWRVFNKLKMRQARDWIDPTIVRMK